MDIDDILASIDDRTIPQETRDLQDLTRTWVNERSAPELLPWPAELMDRVLERIRQQVNTFLPLPLSPKNPRAEIYIHTDHAHRIPHLHPTPHILPPPHPPPNRPRKAKIPNPLPPARPPRKNFPLPPPHPHASPHPCPALPLRAPIREHTCRDPAPAF